MKGLFALGALANYTDSLTGAFTGTGICYRALPTNRQPLLMAQSTITTDTLETFHIAGYGSTEITLHQTLPILKVIISIWPTQCVGPVTGMDF